MNKFYIYIFYILLFNSCNHDIDKSNADFANLDSENSFIENSIIENEELAIVHLKMLINDYTITQRHEYPFDSTITKSSLLLLRKENTDTLSFLLTSLFTKKYRFHMECCHQGYDLRNSSQIVYPNLGLDTVSNPWLYEFLLTTKPFAPSQNIDSILSNGIEFINSGIVMNWIDKNPKYLNDSIIYNNYSRIKEIEIDIESNLKEILPTPPNTP